MKTVTIPSKDELSVWAKEFIRTQENPVILTEDQKFFQSIFDKCLAKVKAEKDTLMLEYTSALNQVNSDESLNDEEKAQAVSFITDELDLNIQELNKRASDDVQKTAQKLQGAYLKKVRLSESKELAQKPSHISLEKNYHRVM